MGPGDVLATYTLVAELGKTPAGGVKTFAAHADGADKLELVILEVLPSGKGIDLAAFADRARSLEKRQHGSLTRIREVRVDATGSIIASDFFDGESLHALDSAAPAGRDRGLPMIVRLRVIIDVLAALSAMHAGDTPILHGEVAPANVLVGMDGTTRLVRAHHAPGRAVRDVASMLGYLAPELLLGDDTADTRADLYGVGVMLWEALSAERLFTESTPDEVLQRQLARDLPRARVAEPAGWAVPLVDVAARALAADPSARYGSAAELAGAIRLVVQTRLAPPKRVAAAVDLIAGDRILARRMKLRPALRAIERAPAAAAPATPGANASPPPAPPSPAATTPALPDVARPETPRNGAAPAEKKPPSLPARAAASAPARRASSATPAPARAATAPSMDAKAATPSPLAAPAAPPSPSDAAISNAAAVLRTATPPPTPAIAKPANARIVTPPASAPAIGPRVPVPAGAAVAAAPRIVTPPASGPVVAAAITIDGTTAMLGDLRDPALPNGAAAAGTGAIDPLGGAPTTEPSGSLRVPAPPTTTSTPSEPVQPSGVSGALLTPGAHPAFRSPRPSLAHEDSTPPARPRRVGVVIAMLVCSAAILGVALVRYAVREPAEPTWTETRAGARGASSARAANEPGTAAAVPATPATAPAAETGAAQAAADTPAAAEPERTNEAAVDPADAPKAGAVMRVPPIGKANGTTAGDRHPAPGARSGRPSTPRPRSTYEPMGI